MQRIDHPKPLREESEQKRAERPGETACTAGLAASELTSAGWLCGDVHCAAKNGHERPIFGARVDPALWAACTVGELARWGRHRSPLTCTFSFSPLYHCDALSGLTRDPAEQRQAQALAVKPPGKSCLLCETLGGVLSSPHLHYAVGCSKFAPPSPPLTPTPPLSTTVAELLAKNELIQVNYHHPQLPQHILHHHDKSQRHVQRRSRPPAA